MKNKSKIFVFLKSKKLLNIWHIGKISFPEVCEVRLISDYANMKKSRGEDATTLAIGKYTDEYIFKPLTSIMDMTKRIKSSQHRLLF